MSNDLTGAARALHAGDLAALPGLLDLLEEADDRRRNAVLRMFGRLIRSTERTAHKKTCEHAAERWAVTERNTDRECDLDRFRDELSLLFWPELTEGGVTAAVAAVAAALVAEPVPPEEGEPF